MHRYREWLASALTRSMGQTRFQFPIAFVWYIRGIPYQRCHRIPS